jgi:integral membrane protein (TIGR01906 family)
MRRLVQLLVLLALPVFLVLTSMRLLMTPAFARWEYQRPGFPDPTVFPIEARQRTVDITLAYVKGAGDDSLIADLWLEDGRPVYNAREVRHLRDVRILTGRAFTVHLVTGLFLLAAVAYLGVTNRGRLAARALLAGSLFTVALIVAIGLVAALSFQFFFVRFHRIFFEGDTWIFPQTDTLIQLFPEKFWFDAALIIVLLTLAQAALIGGAALIWLGVSRRR